MSLCEREAQTHTLSRSSPHIFNVHTPIYHASHTRLKNIRETHNIISFLSFSLSSSSSPREESRYVQVVPCYPYARQSPLVLEVVNPGLGRLWVLRTGRGSGPVPVKRVTTREGRAHRTCRWAGSFVRSVGDGSGLKYVRG